MGYRLNRVNFKNYKVFDNLIINIDEGINIFSGPNGYGKTSFFDAIEFLITGDIRRIKENSVIDGKKAYEANYLARDPKEDVFIRGEFVSNNPSEEPNFTIVKRVRNEGMGKSNNPKSLQDITTTYILNDFDAAIEENKPYNVHPKEKLSFLIGDYSQSRYQTIYYIEQEDRLNFFKYNEKTRIDNLEFLFGIQEEIDRSKKLKDAIAKIRKMIKTITDQLNMIDNQYTNENMNIDTTFEEYKKLLTIDKKWDREDVTINSIHDRDIVLAELMDLLAFCEYRNSYFMDIRNKKIAQLLENEVALNAYLYNKFINSKKEEYNIWLTTFLYWNEQQRIIDKNQYSELNFKALGNYIETSLDMKLVEEIKELEKSISRSENYLVELLSLRDKLRMKFIQITNVSLSECPYCGHQWDSNVLLDLKFDERKIQLQKAIVSTGNELLERKENLKKRVESIYAPLVRENLNKISENIKYRYYTDNKKEIDTNAIVVSGKLRELGIQISLLNDYQDEFLSVELEEIKERLNRELTELPDNYYSANEKYCFEKIFTTFFSNIDSAKKIHVHDINKKIDYIKYRYNVSQKVKQERVLTLESAKSFLSVKLNSYISSYKDLFDECIAEYREIVISAIEIPFFVYCSRILQSYPNGGMIYQNGVTLQANKNNKLNTGIDSLRFVLPGKDHDILYTMSSGQLSGVLLSFTFALYKTFSDMKLSTLFIDDPVNSMDELNIISFIELLKSEFSDVQLVISTHEESFATYAHYKYLKSDIRSQIIKLSEKIMN